MDAHSPAMNEISYSTFLPAFGVISVPDFDHSNRCGVVSFQCFCISLIHGVKLPFICVLAIDLSSLGRCLLISGILFCFDSMHVILYYTSPEDRVYIPGSDAIQIIPS